jgi:hypothetical protein
MTFRKPLDGILFKAILFLPSSYVKGRFSIKFRSDPCIIGNNALNLQEKSVPRLVGNIGTPVKKRNINTLCLTYIIETVALSFFPCFFPSSSGVGAMLSCPRPTLIVCPQVLSLPRILHGIG